MVKPAYVTIGEVTTALLPHSGVVPASLATEMLTLAAGDQVQSFRRPVEYLRSAAHYTGVDCRIPTAGKSKVRCVGAVASHAAVIGGRAVQGVAFARVDRSDAQRRQPWSYYMSPPRRGTVETIGKAEEAQLVEGFLHENDRPGTLNLAAVSSLLVDRVHRHPGLDRRLPLRAERTRLRFVIDPSTESTIYFGLDAAGIRRVSLPALADAETMVELFQDLALHDWLLATVLTAVNHHRAATQQRFIEQTTPLLTNLVPLWMPGARLHGAFAEAWAAMDATSGMSREWASLTQRIRDQLAIATFAAVRKA